MSKDGGLAIQAEEFGLELLKSATLKGLALFANKEGFTVTLPAIDGMPVRNYSVGSLIQDFDKTSTPLASDLGQAPLELGGFGGRVVRQSSQWVVDQLNKVFVLRLPSIGQ